ncbi:hypothetical protein [Aquifex aeolicus]|uniref:Uncharacterized protein aq_678 n=1 Tax=Aquifex aeolicus (strain VF5) TaxID=224324 RepID=Y678_AQUAE|nr:hypothetical protein [Aquifex aeolicus]O66906.1 RecName: Full=Uncharacterized protein aq_678 [Aquifex aeolicus VF5]AAC06867.1 putative protein [Aquifex aeolicus VF5]
MLIVLLALLLLSCSPKYKIVKEYVLPQNTLCVQDCKEKFLECKKACFESYNACLKESVERARKVYLSLLKDYERKSREYEKAYENYLKELRTYRETLYRIKEDLKFYERICSAYKDKEACDKKEWLKKRIRFYERRKPLPPQKPTMPSYEILLKREREACSCECGCEKLYDACFESCRGKVRIKKVCVENCD